MNGVLRLKLGFTMVEVVWVLRWLLVFGCIVLVLFSVSTSVEAGSCPEALGGEWKLGLLESVDLALDVGSLGYDLLWVLYGVVGEFFVDFVHEGVA